MIDAFALCKNWLNTGGNLKTVADMMGMSEEWTTNNWNMLIAKEGNIKLAPESKEMRIQVIKILQKMGDEMGLERGEGYLPNEEESQCLPIPNEHTSDKISSNSGVPDSEDESIDSVNEFGEEDEFTHTGKVNVNNEME